MPVTARTSLPPSEAMTRILGIDPGLRSTGFGVIDACGLFARA